MSALWRKVGECPFIINAMKRIVVNIDVPDEVRKSEQTTVADKEDLFQGRRLFKIPKAKLSVEQTAKITKISSAIRKPAGHTALVQGWTLSTPVSRWKKQSKALRTCINVCDAAGKSNLSAPEPF